MTVKELRKLLNDLPSVYDNLQVFVWDQNVERPLLAGCGVHSVGRLVLDIAETDGDTDDDDN